jgi:hypothetical protein
MGDYSELSSGGSLANRWGHWGAQLLIGAIVGAIALGLRPLPAGSPQAVLVPVLLFTFVIISWLKMREHDRRLCEFCVKSMPLDASEIAEQMHTRFTLAHLGERRELVIGYLVVLIGSNGLLLLGPFGRLGWAAVQATMIYLVLAYSGHRRFQPWCPQCRGGDTRPRVSASDFS